MFSLPGPRARKSAFKRIGPPNGNDSETSPLLDQSGFAGEDSKSIRAIDRPARIGLGIALALSAIAITGLIVASFALGNTNKGQIAFQNPTHFQNITAKYVKIDMDGILDVSMGMLVPPMWMIPPVVRKRGEKRSNVVYQVTPDNQAVLLGTPGVTYDIQFPKKVQSYVNKDYYIFANETGAHTVKFSGALDGGVCTAPYQQTTFDEGRLYNTALFDATKAGCFIHFKVVDCGTVMPIESRCVKFCTSDLSECAYPTVNPETVYAHKTSGPLNTLYTKQTVQAGVGSGSAIEQLTSAPLGPVTATTINLPNINMHLVSGGPASIRNLANDVYTASGDVVGTRVVQLGTPNPWAFPDNCNDVDANPPGDSTDTRVRLSASESGLLSVKIRYSVEDGYDYAVVYKNGALQTFQTGTGPSAANGFRVFDYTTTVNSGDTVDIRFAKDGTCWGGYDLVYFTTALQPLSALEITMPADQTSYVGRTIQLCSIDGLAHSLTLEDPRRFDSNGYWNKLVFQGTPEVACCVEISIISADSLQVSSRNPCTVYCAPAPSEQCIDPERPAETNPLHGWWRRETRTHIETSYFFLDMTQVPIRYSGYTGTITNPTQRNEESSLSLLYSHGNSVYSASTDGNTYDPFTTSFTLKIQPGNEKVVVGNFRGNKDFEYTNYVTHGHYVKTKFEPAFVNYNVEGPDTYLPPVLLHTYFDRFVNMHATAIVKDARMDLWSGYPAAKASLETIISIGKTHSNIEIIRTQTTPSLRLPGEDVTVFRTDVYHHVSPVGRVVISGFTGACAALNGEHVVSTIGTTNNPHPDAGFEDYGSNPLARTVHHDVGVHLDSSSIPVFPGTNIANCTGSVPVLSVSYGPISNDSEYLDVIAAWYYWFYENVGVLLHAIPNVYMNATTQETFAGLMKPIETWNQVQSQLLTSSNPGPTWVGTRTTGAVSVHNNPALYSFFVQFFYGLDTNSRLIGSVADYQGQHAIRPDAEGATISDTDASERSTFWYNIAQKNYLVNVSYPAWKMQGTNKTHPDNLFAQAVSPGGEGDELHTIMIPHGEIPPTDYSYFDGVLGYVNDGYELYPNWYHEFQQNRFFVAKVNPEFTNGTHIGYIRFADTLVIDAYFFSVFGTFCPTDLCNVDSPRNNREGLVSAFAVFMEHLLVDLQCEQLIVDIRGNIGGNEFDVAALNDLMGSGSYFQKQGFHLAQTGNDYGKLFDMRQFEHTPGFLEAVVNSDKTFPNISALYYPDALFSNGNVIILTNERATSGGDLFPNRFMGPALDGQLGNNTQVHIIGALDGRVPGYLISSEIPFSATHPRLVDSAGNGVSPMSYYIDAGFSALRVDGSTCANRHPGLEIDQSPTLTGLSGSNALPQDWEELVYKDLGFSTNNRLRLYGDNQRPQTPVVITETNPLSTVSGSNIVTVTTSSPHNLVTGDDVAFGVAGVNPVATTAGIPGAALTGGHVITVTSATTFTFEATLEASYDCYPRIDCAVATPATSTASGVGGTIRMMVRSHWRDAWLEQAIQKAIIAPSKKRSRTRRLRRSATLKKKTATRTSGKRHLFGRDISCSGATLQGPVSGMPTTRPIALALADYSPDDTVGREQALQKARDAVIESISTELKNGGMCVNDEGRLMATSTCKEVARIVNVGHQTALKPGQISLRNIKRTPVRK